MRPGDFTAEDFIAIAGLYSEICGGRPIYFESVPENWIRNIQQCSGLELRVGSHWDPQSKFEIKCEGWKESVHIKAYFHPNFNPKERSGERYEQALAAKTQFEQRAFDYLNLDIE